MFEMLKNPIIIHSHIFILCQRYFIVAVGITEILIEFEDRQYIL